MADEIISLGIQVESGDADKSLGDLKKAIDGISDSNKELNKTNKAVEGSIEALQEEIDSLSKDWGDMGRKVELYQSIALKAGKESPVGQEAVRQAAELKREMDNVTQAIDLLSKEGNKLRAALDLGGVVVGGFGAIQGAMALAGGESEEFEKTIQKLIAAQSILQGIEQVRLLTEKDSQIVLAAKNFQTKAAVAATWLYNAAQKALGISTVGTTTATKAMNLVLKLSPIGLIIGLITAAVAGFFAFKDSIMGVVNSISKFFNPVIEGVIDVMQWMGLVDDDVTQKAKANAKEKLAASEKVTEQLTKELEAFKQSSNAAIKAMDREIALRKARGEDTEDLERKRLIELEKNAKKEEKILRAQLKANIETWNQLHEIQKRGGEFSNERQKELNDEEKRIRAAIAAQKQAFKDAFNAVDVFDAERARKAEEARLKEEEKQKADWLKRKEELKKIQEERIKLSINSILDEHERARATEENNFRLQIEDLKKRNVLTAELEEKLRSQHLNKMLEIDEKHQEKLDKAAEERRNKLIENDKTQADLAMESERLLQEARIANMEEGFEKEVELSWQQHWQKMDQLEEQGLLTEELRAELTTTQNARIQELRDTANQQELDNDQKLRDAKLTIAKGSLDSLIALNDILTKDGEKHAKRAKQLALVQLAIDTGVAIAGAVKQASTNIANGVNPIMMIADIATRTAAILANVAKAKQMINSGTASGGSVSVGGATQQATQGAQISPVSNTSTTLPQEPTQVFVTEEDITSTQNRVSVIEQSATFG